MLEWSKINAKLMRSSEETVKRMLEQELAGAARAYVLARIYCRLSKLRRNREKAKYEKAAKTKGKQ